MDDDYRRWDRECEIIRSENGEILKQFRAWLSAMGLSAKTIDRHIGNVDFYINHCLLYEDAIRPKDGWEKIDYFLGYWFIRKAMWASEASIRNNSVSLKKFYTFMHQKGLIDKEALESVRQAVRDNISDWVATLRRFDDPAVTEPEDIWGF